MKLFPNYAIASSVNVSLIDALVLILVFGFGVAANPQSTPRNPDRGAKVGNSYAVGDFETINTTNGNLMINFPLGALPPGRGAASAGVYLTYNSKLYNMRTDRRPDYRQFDAYYNRTVIEPDLVKGGWSLGGGYGLEFETRFGNYEPNCAVPGTLGSEINDQIVYSNKLSVVFPDGSRHEMIPYGHHDKLGDRYFNITMDGMIRSCSGLPTYTARPVYYSRDGSFLRLDSTSNANWTLSFPDGSKVVNGGRIYDRNGNYVDAGFGAADQLGRSIVVGYDSATGEQLVTSKGVGGDNLVWRIKWKTIAVNKTYRACQDGYVCPGDEFSLPDTRDYLHEGFSVVDKIIQPTQLGGGSYTFTYNGANTDPFPALTNGWGELSGVELPSGAKVTYDYLMDGDDGPLLFEETKNILKNHVVTKTLKYDLEYDGQTVNDGAVETWGYGVGPYGGSVTGPDGGTTETEFGVTDPDVNGGYLPWNSGLTLKTTSPDGTKVENIWERSIPTPCHSASTCADYGGYHYGDNPYIKTTFTSLKDSSGNYTLTSAKDFTYDKNGNATEVREYDFMPYSSVPRDGNGRPTGLPANASSYLRRITKSGFNNPAPTASSTDYANQNIYIFAVNTKLLNLPAWTEVQDGSGNPKSRAEMEYDNTAYSTNTVAGNLTYSRVWDSTKGPYSDPLVSANWIVASTEYNEYGMPRRTTDANGVQTTITYGCVDGSASCDANHETLYPTKKEVASNYPALKRTSTAKYDFHTGVTTESKDSDNDVKAITEYDNLGRPTKLRNAADTALESWTRTEYHDGNTSDPRQYIIVRSDIETIGDGRKVAVQFFDQLGRVRLAKTLEDTSVQSATNETDGIKVQTRYMFTNSGGTGYTYQLTSNPYRAATSTAASSEPTMGWTRSKAWSTGRKSEVETFSGASLPAPWGNNSNSMGVSIEEGDTNAETTTDEAGRKRRTVTDGLGRLVRVDEPDNTGDLGTVGSPVQPTNYFYDALGNLIQIVQGVQTRSFAYSSLSRLLTASNPESGTLQYTYDANGNLLTKTDARGIQTIHTYDALNRVLTKTYSDSTPAVSFTYDDSLIPYSKGKLTKVGSTVSESLSTAFDVKGRITSSRQAIDGQTYNFAYTYNLDDDLLTQTYPTGKVVRFGYDASGDLAQVARQTANGDFAYANSFQYSPHGQVAQLRYGNGKWETAKFNSARQITEIGLGNSAGDSGLWKTVYEYGTWQGTTLDIQKNNGSLARQTSTVPTIGSATGFTAIQTYTYDALDRVKSAIETVGGVEKWKQTFLYDRFGNKQLDASNTTLLSTESAVAKVANPEVLSSNNRFKEDQDNDAQLDYLYDLSGNVTKDSTAREFTYDAENRQKTATGTGLSVQYFYDGNGKRIKTYNAVTDQTTVFVYDADGDLAAEYTINVPAPSTPTISYTTDDALGSPRVVTNSFGEIKGRRDFLPFGEELHAGLGNRNASQKYSSNSDDTRQKFTTYQRDAETGLDFAQARYYSPMHGRFTSPDEFSGGPDELFDFADSATGNPTFYADLSNPQSLNKYQYTYNNPYKFTDEDGHCPPCTGQVLLGPTITETLPMIRPYTGVIETIGPKVTTAAESAVTSAIRPGTVDLILVPTLQGSRIFAPPRGEAGGTVRLGSRGTSLETARPKNLKPHPDAKGPHSTFRQNKQGQTTRYTTWRPNPRNPKGFEPKKSVDTKPGGKPHTNSKTKQPVPPPHVTDKKVPGGVRPARKYELP